MSKITLCDSSYNMQSKKDRIIRKENLGENSVCVCPEKIDLIMTKSTYLNKSGNEFKGKK